MIEFIFGLLLIALLIISLGGFRIIRPYEVGLIERFGKFIKQKSPGLTWLVPFADRLVRVNMTEQMVDVQPQMVITKDKLNVKVDAVVYYKILKAPAAMYHVDDHEKQLTSLAKTTLRAVIGQMSLTEANENRNEINNQIEKILDKETDSYGVDVLRVELQSIDPPHDVQESMNKVVKAEQEKIAAKDLATAKEVEADGFKRAEVKKAEGLKQAAMLEAEGKARAITTIAEAKSKEIQVVNTSIQKHFKNEAQVYKKLETAERALKDGTKYIVDTDKDISLVLSDMAGVTPLNKKPGKH